jgi:Holliday junction resolvasome RuvABC endonuclease subunit
MRGVTVGEERTRLIKGNITGNPNALSNQILTMISLMLRVINKKDTLDRLCR